MKKMDKEKKPIEIELRSDEFQEIVQQSPRWMVRSGISLVLGLLVLLLAGSYFFKYPDVIETKITLSIDQSVVSPEQSSRITGKVNLSFKEARKVAVGQKVNIRLEGYTSMEYGFIQGKVKSISLVPNNENYVVEVELPQDLITNYNIPLKFSQEMKGSAEIITEDLKLIQRFINPVKSLLKHRISASS